MNPATLVPAPDPAVIDLPPTFLRESDLVGSSRDVIAYRNYCCFCRRLGIRPASWDFMYTQRLQELVEMDPAAKIAEPDLGDVLVEDADAD